MMKQIQKSGVTEGRPGFPFVRTCLFFFAIVLLLNLNEWLILKPQHLEWLQSLTARIIATILNGLGLQTILQGTRILFAGAHWEIVSECTALQAMYVFVAFLVAYPSSFRSKLIGIAVGLPLVFLVNLVRLLILAWAIQAFPDYAEIVHDYVWQIAFLFLLVLMWLGWIDLVVKRE